MADKTNETKDIFFLAKLSRTYEIISRTYEIISRAYEMESRTYDLVLHQKKYVVALRFRNKTNLKKLNLKNITATDNIYSNVLLDDITFIFSTCVINNKNMQYNFVPF